MVYSLAVDTNNQTFSIMKKYHYFRLIMSVNKLEYIRVMVTFEISIGSSIVYTPPAGQKNTWSQ